MPTTITGDTGVSQVQAGALIETSVNRIGYGTGSGGTVVQATSKSTAVTLNKPTGKITMASDALAAGTSAYFTLNNSLLTANDILVVNNSFGSGNYTVACQVVANGSAYIRVWNVSAGSLAEAVTINFAIIKGSNA